MGLKNEYDPEGLLFNTEPRLRHYRKVKELDVYRLGLRAHGVPKPSGEIQMEEPKDKKTRSFEMLGKNDIIPMSPRIDQGDGDMALAWQAPCRSTLARL